MSGFEPVAMDIEEAVVGPVAGGDEKDYEENRAVDTWAIEEICKKEKCDNKSD